jgi:MFS transporter, ACS family, D-galactonate transporter
MPATPPAPRETTAASRALWPMIALLVVSVAINYIDRSNLSIAAPLLKKKSEMGLSPAQLGLLLSSFFWSYALFQLVAGWLVDRCNVNAVLIAGFVLWSGATAVTGLVGGFGTLLALRLLLGIGESVAYPCYSKIFTEWLDEKRRGVANALIDAGSKFGPAVGTLVGGLLMARFGWRSFFIALGLCGLLWVPCWLRWMPRGSARAKPPPEMVPGFAEILRHRAIAATFIGHFCGNYFWYFLLTWLPSYLVNERDLSMDTMAYAGATTMLVAAGATILAGWLSHRALKAGATPTRVRKTCTVTGLSLATAIVLVPLVRDATVSMALLMAASIAYGVFASSHWTITQTIAGPLAAGRWSGMQNFVGNLSGVVAPWLTGQVVQHTGNFFWAFAATAGVVLLGAMAYLFGLGPVEPAQWRARPDSLPR